MDLRHQSHQSNAMCIIMLGGEDTPVVCNDSREPHTSNYPSSKKKQPTNYSIPATIGRPVEFSFESAMI